jgi:hypothetical protein
MVKFHRFLFRKSLKSIQQIINIFFERIIQQKIFSKEVNKRKYLGKSLKSIQQIINIFFVVNLGQSIFERINYSEEVNN